jgi:hypothetical protein
MKDVNLVSTNTEKNMKSGPTAFIYWGVTLTIVVLVLVGYTFISRSKVSADYINKFNAITALYQKIDTDSNSAVKQLVGIRQSLTVKENVKDYNGAAQIVDQNLTNINNLITKVNDLNSSIADFNTVAEKVSDVTARNDSLQVISLWQQDNASFLRLLNYEAQRLLPAKQYYKDMALGRKATLLTNAQTKAISQGIQSETDNMSSLGTSIKAAYSTLSEDLGMRLQIPTADR